MSSASEEPGPGGFLVPNLPSPPASSINSPSVGDTTLPRPRSSPLRPGSAKESSFINYVDRKLLEISRRYEKRFNANFEDGATSSSEGRGYESYGELVRDLVGVVDVVWMSGTPSLQTPYLLTIALTSCICLKPFPFSPRSTFHLLHKLDIAFCSLLQGANPATGETLPGFEGGRGKLSTTEKVRMKGLVERTRVAVVEVAASEGSVTEPGDMLRSDLETEDDLTTDNDEDNVMEGMQLDGNHGRWEMEVARVYEKTIVELGVSLDVSQY